jgi:hypothetical protein
VLNLLDPNVNFEDNVPPPLNRNDKILREMGNLRTLSDIFRSEDPIMFSLAQIIDVPLFK